MAISLMRLLPRWLDGHLYLAQSLAFDRNAGTAAEAVDQLLASLRLPLELGAHRRVDAVRAAGAARWIRVGVTAAGLVRDGDVVLVDIGTTTRQVARALRGRLGKFISVGGVPASDLLRRVGDRTPLKEWQVSRVIEKISSLIHFPPPSDDPSAGFTLRFDLAIDQENHDGALDLNGDGQADEAGFTVLLLGSDARGIAINFWQDRIWASGEQTVA